MSVLIYSRKLWGICECGHPEWMHEDFVYGGEDGYDIIPKKRGHGICNGDGGACNCKQYTWVRYEVNPKGVISTPEMDRMIERIQNNKGD